MEFREHPLLNTPSLMALILRQAEAGPAGVDDFVARLNAVLRQAHEAPPVSQGEIRERIEALAEDLASAQLLFRGEEGFALTARGLKALDDHPEGFSRPDMMAWPEYARKIAACLPHAAGDDPRPRAYDQGFAARLSGKSLEENPFRPDTSDHLAWEGGWSDSADQTRAARTA